MSEPSRTVEDFFNNEYLAYAKYTLDSRALPSLVDGFKPAQRKIAFAAAKLWKGGSEKPLKVFQLGGQAAAMSFFHHGSLDQTIIGMTQEFKNSMPIFQGIGQFGSLRAPEAGAARYVGVKFNDNFRKLYKDFDLTTPQFEEGEEIEPRYFLPIIPTVLLNGGSGIAVGFATNILNRHPIDLIDACTEMLKSGTVSSPLKPWIHGFYGNIEPLPDSNGRGWAFIGLHDVKNTSVVEVTEVPPSFTYEKYEAHLDNLVEKGIITSYEDASSDRPKYVLRFPRASLASLRDKEKLADTLKMRETETENITTLDEHGRLKVFDSAQELVAYFVAFRLGYYVQRKDHSLNGLTREIDILAGKAHFVQAVIDGSIVLANVPVATILDQIQAKGIAAQGDGYDYLLSMPIYSLTREKLKDLHAKIASKNQEKAQVENTSPVEFYLADLTDLRKQLVSKGWKTPTPPATPPPPKSQVKAFLSEGVAKPDTSSVSNFLDAFDEFFG